jgi:hypothetical protein
VAIQEEVVICGRREEMAAPQEEDARSEAPQVIVEGVEQGHDSGIINKLVGETGRHGLVQKPKASENSSHAHPPHQPQDMNPQEAMAAPQAEDARSEDPPGVRVIVEAVE